LIPLPNPIPLNSRGEISNAAGASCQLFLQQNIVYTFTLYDANGNQLNQAQSVEALTPTAQSLGALIYPTTAAEITTGLVINTTYNYGDMRRYGLVPNS